MKFKIIGDVHGKLNKYKEIVDKCDNSICVGDFGFKKEWDWHVNNIKGNHWINPGNHDYMPVATKSQYPSTGNFKFFNELVIFTVRGADSIDRIYRTEGIDWFSDEELSYNEMQEAIDFYEKIKPKYVVTHDCPQTIMQLFFGYPDKSITRNGLQIMFEIHKPEIWFFGHHHTSVQAKIDGTNFVCLAELETYDLIF